MQKTSLVIENFRSEEYHTAMRSKQQNYLELLWILAKTDFKLRYHGSVLGYLWTILKPLLNFAVLWIVFSVFVRWEIPHYQLYLLLGILLWHFFVEATTGGVLAFSQKAGLIKKIYFPRILIVIASTLSSFIGLIISIFIFFVFYIFSGIHITPAVFLFPFLIILLYILSLGISFTLSSLFIKFRDIVQVWEVLLQVLFWLIPITYPLSVVPERFRFLLKFNPVTDIIQGARLILLNGRLPDMHSMVYVVLTSLTVLTVGYFIFIRLTKDAAEKL